MGDKAYIHTKKQLVYKEQQLSIMIPIEDYNQGLIRAFQINGCAVHAQSVEEQSEGNLLTKLTFSSCKMQRVAKILDDRIPEWFELNSALDILQSQLHLEEGQTLPTNTIRSTEIG